MTVEGPAAGAVVFWTAATTGAEVGTTGAEVAADAERAGQFVTSGWKRVSRRSCDSGISGRTYAAGGDGLNSGGVNGLSDGRGSSNEAGEESRGDNSETHFD